MVFLLRIQSDCYIAFEGCNVEMKQQGTIYSPGYKVGRYPSNVTCAWILTRNTGEVKPISLRFTEFKLKSNSDYVEVSHCFIKCLSV